MCVYIYLLTFVLVSEWHPTVYEILATEPGAMVVDPRALPMVVPPKPWQAYDTGGYLLHSGNCVRLKVLIVSEEIVFFPLFCALI